MIDLYKANGKDMQRMINTHIEASKIGRQIAEQVMDLQKQGRDSPINDSPSNNPDPESSLPLPTADVRIVFPYYQLKLS